MWRQVLPIWVNVQRGHRAPQRNEDLLCAADIPRLSVGMMFMVQPLSKWFCVGRTCFYVGMTSRIAGGCRSLAFHWGLVLTAEAAVCDAPAHS